jgi:hypothetical protein
MGNIKIKNRKLNYMIRDYHIKILFSKYHYRINTLTIINESLK